MQRAYVRILLGPRCRIDGFLAPWPTKIVFLPFAFAGHGSPLGEGTMA